MSHLACIGFDVRGEEALQRMAREAFEKGQPRPHDNGFYIQYRDASSAELWLQFDQQKQLVDLHPHFFVDHKTHVCLTAKLPSGDSDHEGGFFAVSYPSVKDDPDSGRFPFMFDVPDFACTSDQLPIPKSIDVQLVAFTQTINTYPSRGQLKKQTGQKPFNVHPIGLLGDDGDVAARPKAVVEMSGTIESISKKVNGMTNQPFGQLAVKIDGGTLIAVLPHTELLRCDPQKGHAFSGQFWMSGRLPTVKKSFFQRLRQLY